MSSDVMIVCKEFKNSYDDCYGKMWDSKSKDTETLIKIQDECKPKYEAVFIDEASMGEPWYDFGKWFVDKFYNGYSMLEILTCTMSDDKTQKDIHEMQNTIFDNPLTQFDYEMICKAIDEMQCHPKMEKDRVKEYLKKCIGKSISTENW